MTKRSRRKGKRGEDGAAILLRAAGWYIPHREIQGLAGEDIFARDPDGKWWAVEVKNTNKWDPDYVRQAREQAEKRWHANKREMKNDPLAADVLKFLGIEDYRKSNWMVMWHPSNTNARSSTWVAVVREDNANGFSRWIAPFTGRWDDSPLIIAQAPELEDSYDEMPPEDGDDLDAHEE